MERENLLVVDQELDSLTTTRTALQKEGYSVFCAQSSLDAITLLRKKPIDLLITALAMPDLTAPAFLQQAHLIQPSVGSILMCNNDSPDLLIKSFQAGAQAVLVKPFSTEELTKVVGDILQKASWLKKICGLKPFCRYSR